MRSTLWSALLLVSCAQAGQTARDATVGPEVYYPPPEDGWERRPPEALGMDPALLQEAITFAQSHETSMPRDPGQYLRDRFAGLEHQQLVGPTQERGGVNGLVVRNGYIVAEWGDTRRADMTFSVTKSYLSTLAGIALDRGLIRDLDDPVADYVRTEQFASTHNRLITWRMLLQQTSEWVGYRRPPAGYRSQDTSAWHLLGV